MNPLVSIIIPMYNSEKYIARCIDSLLNQDYHNVEIVIVDDGSTDKSIDICREYAQYNTNISLYSQNNSGVSAARNKGLKNSNGKYIVFVDSDDFVYKNYISDLVNVICVKYCDIAISTYTFDLRYKSKKSKIQTFKSYNGNDAIIEMMLGKSFDSSICCKLISADLIKGIFFDEKLSLAEDMLFLYMALKKSRCAFFINNVGYCYDRKSEGAVSNITQKHLESMSVFEELLKCCNDKNLYEAILSKYISTSFHLLLLKNEYDINRDSLKDIIKKYRYKAIIGKKISNKVRIACMLSYISFSLILKILKSR